MFVCVYILMYTRHVIGRSWDRSPQGCAVFQKISSVFMARKYKCIIMYILKQQLVGVCLACLPMFIYIYIYIYILGNTSAVMSLIFRKIYCILFYYNHVKFKSHNQSLRYNLGRLVGYVPLPFSFLYRVSDWYPMYMQPNPAENHFMGIYHPENPA